MTGHRATARDRTSPPPSRTPAPSKNNSTFYRGHLPLVRVSVGVIELVFRVTVTIIKVGYIQGCSGAGTQWNAVPANHVVLVRLTLDQFIFWPKLPPNAGFGIKNLKKNFQTSSAGGGDPVPHPPPARLHVVRGGAHSPVAGT